MDKTYRYFVGIDWGSEEHEACVVDEAGKKVLERRVTHSGEGLGELLEALNKLCTGQVEQMAVAIEVPRGPVVEAVLERGMAVYSVNPKQLDRFRDRHSVAGAKDDRLDAFVLADSLRTDRHCFEGVSADHELIIELRAWSRMEDDLKIQENRLANQTREELNRYYPQLLKLSPAMDEPWVWTLWELAPTPEAGRNLGKQSIEALLKEHRIRRIDAEAVAKALQTAPLHVAPGTTKATVAHIKQLLKRQKLVQEQLKECKQETERLLALLQKANPTGGGEHGGPSDAEILDSLPGVGRVVIASLLTEGGRALAERDYAAIRALGGVAPVTQATGKKSGKKALVLMRRACSKRLRNALYHWARVSMQTDEWAKERYHALRSKGHSHGRALRGLADRWLSVLFAMLKSLTLYDPARRGQSGSAVLSAAS
jgi:transposase